MVFDYVSRYAVFKAQAPLFTGLQPNRIAAF
jgi:hypothetical protein